MQGKIHMYVEVESKTREYIQSRQCLEKLKLGLP